MCAVQFSSFSCAVTAQEVQCGRGYAFRVKICAPILDTSLNTLPVEVR
jgi:hypothetical protein